MRAVVFEQYGGPEVLQLVSIQKPVPKRNEILVKIYATTVTAEDPKMRGFNHPPLLKIPIGLMFGFNKPKKPILGIEFSGVVEATGNKVTRYKPGDQVFGYTGLGFGAYAEYKCLSEQSLISAKPKNFTFEESVSLVNGPLSSLAYLKKKASIKEGDHLLIYGASGSVGTAAIQLAKYFGAKVTGVCSSKNLGIVRSLGADKVIDYTKDDFTKGKDRYDIIFDTVGRTSIKACMGLLKPKGKLLVSEFGFLHIIRAIISPMLRKKMIVASSNFYWKVEDLQLMKELAEQGFYKPVIDKIFTLKEISNAHKYVEQGHKTGNVAIKILE